jgi:hypothetical protein
MEHFYTKIHGWFNEGYPGAYKKIFDYFKSEPEHIVEIGVWKGRSSSYLGVELYNHGWTNVKFDLIDHFEGSPEHKRNPKFNTLNLYDIAVENLSPLNGKINYEIFKLSSEESSKKYNDESLDFVFIDGAHEYNEVLKDINLWYPKVKKGGIICGDDYCSDWNSVIKAVDDFFGNRVVFIENKHWWVEKI